jgi:N,N-dimethylformamidase beta subunit-like, C-terminal
MLIGYVSDENYCALHDVAVEFEQNGKTIVVLRSSPSGAVNGDVPAGDYRIILAREGYGSKHITAHVHPDKPLQLRLLSNSLYGYAWPKWVKSGQKGEFRVHSPEPYHLTLWRYGLRKELVQPIGWFDEHGPHANLQRLPDGDFTQTGVGWNRYGFSKKYKSNGECKTHGANTLQCTPECFYQPQLAPEQSGLYFFHAETPSGKFLSFPWVVAPAKPSAPIAVIASTNTWNAYNNFGGRSNYINPTQLPPRPTISSRLDLSRYVGTSNIWSSRNSEYSPLSFDRPEPFNHIPKDIEATDPIRGRQSCHLAEAEWRLLAWLEREGFNYDFYSDYQLHAGQLDLDSYKVLIISTHPEYWSKDAYQRVKKWVFEKGGRLMYLGGNGIDCEVELPSEAVMKCNTWLPNPHGVMQFIDPADGKRYDCRFHYSVESPAGLLGVVFTETGVATSAPYRVIDVSHWIFRNTGLKNGDTFGKESQHERCPGGASGHETDKRTPSSPKDAMPLARGINVNDGGAEIILHETKKGGAVFSVGSITWTASVMVDRTVSKITRNVLERFLMKSKKRKRLRNG